MMVVRLPQANMEAKKAAISISCFFLKRCATEIGSGSMKEGLLYSFTLASRNSFSFLLTTKNNHHIQMKGPCIVHNKAWSFPRLSNGLFEVFYQVFHVL